MAPVFILLQTVFGAILEVFLLCIAGYFLARRGILDKKTQKQINRLNVSLFTPSLLFSKVAFFLTPAKLRELWVIPIFFVIVTVISMTIAMCLGFVFQLKPSQRSFAMAAAMFMNSNSLPIALMQSLVVTVPGLKWDEDDEDSSMLGRALTYLVLYSTLGMVLRWSYGVKLLSQADPEGSDDPPPHEIHNQPSHVAHDHDHQYYGDGCSTTPTVVLHSSESDEHEHEHDTGNLKSVRILAESRSNATALEATQQQHPQQDQVFYSFPNTPANSKTRLAPPVRRLTLTSSGSSLPFDLPVPDDELRGDADEEDEEDPDDEPIVSFRRRRYTTPTSSRFHSILRQTTHRIKKTVKFINEFMTVPLWAALASIIVALISPLQHVLEEHVQPVKGFLTAAGNCSIPLTLVVLGAYFYAPEGGGGGGAKGTGMEVSRHGEENNNGGTNEYADLQHDDDEEAHLTHRKTKHKRRSWASTYSDLSLRSMLSLQGLRDLTGSKTKAGGMSDSESNEDRDQPGSQTRTAKFTGRKNRGETTTVIIAVLSRMILTPVVLLPLMAVSAKYNYPEVFDDPVFVVSNVLLVSSPPALTLAQITQAASGDAFERLISRTIFWAYCVVTPPATIVFVVIGLMMANL